MKYHSENWYKKQQARSKKSRQGKLGKIIHSPKAIQKPVSIDLVWAAGLFEGEGHISINHGIHVTITQVDKWVISKFEKFFGGHVAKVSPRGISKKISWRWSISGSRARGFVMTVYKFFSPRLQNRVKEALPI